ncbi:MAG: hypothetical protein AB7O52_02000 [Planctomycetota bacterium]
MLSFPPEGVDCLYSAKIEDAAELNVSQAFPDQFESYRPLRSDSLRAVLDEEFRKSYRFEGFSNVIHDIKELFRRVVTRDDEADLPD